MRLSRLLLIMLCITFFAVIYVYQQAEIFRLAYMGQKKITVLQVLLDKNSVLRYNKQQDTSLIRIGDRVSENKDFQMPNNYRLVKLTSPEEKSFSAGLAKRENILSRIFGIKKQAEAKTINP